MLIRGSPNGLRHPYPHPVAILERVVTIKSECWPQSAGTRTARYDSNFKIARLASPGASLPASPDRISFLAEQQELRTHLLWTP